MLDSRVIVLEDPRLKAATADNVASIFQHTYWWPYAELPLYRPATTLSFLANYSLFGNGDRPFGYHVVNLALHTINVLLLFAIGQRLTASGWAAGLAAGLWAVHPLGTEAVANIVGRSDLLAAGGALAAFYAYLKSKDAQPAAAALWYVLAVVAALVAAFAKESGVVIVAMVLVWELFAGKRRNLAPTLTIGACVGIPVLLFLYLRSTVVGAGGGFPFVDNPILGASAMEGRATALAVLGRYVGLFFWPAQLSADYSFRQIPLASGTPSEIALWILVAVSAAAIVGLIVVNRTAGLLALAAALFVLPASNLLVPTGTIMAERLMYLPAGLLILAIVTALSVPRFARLHMAGAAIVLVLVAAATVRTMARNSDWQDELTLWTATASTSPGSFKSHSGLAEALRQSDKTGGSLNRAIAEKEQSLAILAEAPAALTRDAMMKSLYEVATYYMERGEWRAAHPVNAAPADIEADFQRAAEIIERYLAMSPPTGNAAQAEMLRAVAYQRLLKGDQAVAAARAAAAAEPLNPAVYRALASSLVSAGSGDEAGARLMTGFMLTGNQELRLALAELYERVLDPGGCAVTRTGSSVTLNSSCPLVRRHLCAAYRETSQLHRGRGRADLADQAVAAMRGLQCTS